MFLQLGFGCHDKKGNAYKVGDEWTEGEFVNRCYSSPSGNIVFPGVIACLTPQSTKVPLNQTLTEGGQSYECIPQAPDLFGAIKAHLKTSNAGTVNEQDTSLQAGNGPEVPKPKPQGARCQNPCISNGISLCNGEEHLTKEFPTGSVLIRCKNNNVEEFCRVKAFKGPGVYELVLGTYTSVDGFLLTCAQFESSAEIQPANSAPDNAEWKSILATNSYKFVTATLYRGQ